MDLRRIQEYFLQRSRSLHNALFKAPGLKLSLAALILICALSPALPTGRVKAAEDPRSQRTTKTMMAHHWLLKRWADNALECDFHIAGTNLPTVDEVKNNCSDTVYQDWIGTPACAQAGPSCAGLFLVNLGREEGPVVEVVQIPPPGVTIRQANCQPWVLCSERPNLIFAGSEPMRGQSIVAIHVRLGDQERICRMATCELRMPITKDEGVKLEYWATSSLGDESPHLALPVRNRSQPDHPDKYLLEVLDDSFSENAPPGAIRWGRFPSPANPISTFLVQPATPAELATDSKYLYLDGSLIRKGVVDVKDCPSGGLNPNGTANACGEERARKQAIEWQNRYDSQILSAARAFQVPARLLKALIAQETQFWPNSDTPYEIGLGRMTENGADLLMNWDLAYYLHACTNLWKVNPCAAGYSSLSDEQKTILRGTSLAAVGTDAEINLIAATLQASSLQVAQMIKNVTLQEAGSVSTLEDLWALSIGNYHIGSGCVGEAITTLADTQVMMSWVDVAGRLPDGCASGKTYVETVVSLAR